MISVLNGQLSAEETVLAEFVKLCIPSLSPREWEHLETVLHALCDRRKNLNDNSLSRVYFQLGVYE